MTDAVLNACAGYEDEAICLQETCDEVADGSISPGHYTFIGTYLIASDGTFRVETPWWKAE